jgi:hypothetical protein
MRSEEEIREQLEAILPVARLEGKTKEFYLHQIGARVATSILAWVLQEETAPGVMLPREVIGFASSVFYNDYSEGKYSTEEYLAIWKAERPDLTDEQIHLKLKEYIVKDAH